VLWRSRASEIMMRLNAPIPALLALAGLSLFPASSLATPTHHLAHSATAPSAKRPAHGKVAESARATRTTKHRSAKTAPAKTTRVHAHAVPKGHQLRQAVRSSAPTVSRPEVTATEATSQKATSEDFLRAASAQTVTQVETQPAVAIHGTSRPEELNETGPVTHAPARKPVAASKQRSVAKPVPVVSVIRPAVERPQLASVEEVASTPVILPNLYNKRGHLIVPPPLKGSHEILVHQNEVADRDGLARVQNDDDLLDMRSKKMLVGIAENDGLQVDDRLPENRRYCRPWTAKFLSDIAAAHSGHFTGGSLEVTSAVRTVEYQRRLRHINGNAAAADGDIASPHLTGGTIDIAKAGMTAREIGWLRSWLIPLEQQGKIDVEEEFRQSCFHISVYKNYTDSKGIPFDPGAMLATRVR